VGKVCSATKNLHALHGLYCLLYLTVQGGAGGIVSFKPNLANDTQKLRYFFQRIFYLRILDPYTTWNDLMTNVVTPLLTIYKSLGLGKDIVEVQSLYLNKFDLGKGENISQHFNFLPIIEDSFESSIVFQARYDVPNNLVVQLKLNGNRNPSAEKIQFFFECSSFARPISQNEKNDYLTLSKRAHDKVNEVFLKIISEK